MEDMYNIFTTLKKLWSCCSYDVNTSNDKLTKYWLQWRHRFKMLP